MEREKEEKDKEKERERREKEGEKRKRDEVRDEKVKIKFLDGSDNLNLSSFPTESIADSFCFSLSSFFLFLSSFFLSLSPSLPPVLMISSPSTSGRKGHLSFFAYHPRKKTCLEEISFHFFFFLSFSFFSFLFLFLSFSFVYRIRYLCCTQSIKEWEKRTRNKTESENDSLFFLQLCNREKEGEREKERRRERKEERKK